MLNADRVDADRAVVLAIDFQTKLLPAVEDAEEVLAAAAKLVRGAAIFKLPVVATVQYVKGIGPTHAFLAKRLRAGDVEPMEKLAFSACGDQAIRERLRTLDRPQVVVCGIEGHVCVLQTVLDLRAMDYQVFVCADAVGSRDGLDLDLAMFRMRDAGATITSVEAVLFELCEVAGTDRFQRLLEIIKSEEYPEEL